jgi:D-glycero-D-manno-heptose 1,7-bisphosphate phosphatase
MNKAVFIDKDGTLIKNVPYNVDPAHITLETGAAAALRLLKQNDYLLVVISNQSGVAHGFFKETALESVKDRIQQLLQAEGAGIDAFYFCPHHPDGNEAEYAIRCPCRKPEPGMLFKAAVDLNIDLSKSWMIGDILHDVEAGNKAACKTILIDNGNETEWITNEMRWPSYCVRNLSEAAHIILQTKRDVKTTYKLQRYH